MHNTEAYSVGGKPTDSVIIGIYSLNLKPDLVVSGVNIGENLSYESIMTSGTVGGAALEASNQGVPSIAFSLEVEDQGKKFDDPRYSEQNCRGKNGNHRYLQAVVRRRIPLGHRCCQRQYPGRSHRRL